MRVSSAQAPQQVAYAVAGAIAFAHPAYSMTIGDDHCHIEDLKSDSQVNGTAVQGVAVSAPSSRFSVNVIPDEAIFGYLAAQWMKESAEMSSSSEMVTLPSYQRIVGMGDKAIPHILREMERANDKPDNWFWALRNITGENPVTDELRGNRKEMARIWIEWARGRYAW